MDWDDLRYVLALSRGGTMSAAADELGVTHTTVSRRLSAFEKHLGVRLFDRLADGYAATAVGVDLVGVAERMEEEVLSLDARVTGQDEKLSGTLRVTTVDILAEVLLENLDVFTERYPGVELELSVDYAPLNLTRREADVALRLTNDPPENLVGRKLARAEFALYGARSLVGASGEQTPLAELPWISWDRRAGARLTEARIAELSPDAPVVLRVDSTTVMHHSIRRGVGISFLSCVVGDRDEALVRLRPPEPDFGMDIWVLTHPDLRSTARVRAFLDFAADELTRLRPVFAGEG
jgi:DNA-binding transcriptional LysR family regulator